MPSSKLLLCYCFYGMDETANGPGRLVTASGVSSGIDGALHMVEKYSGPGGKDYPIYATSPGALAIEIIFPVTADIGLSPRVANIVSCSVF